MRLHFLGICGTFMGSLAQLAKSAGHQVSGSDANVYPPMSTQLQQAGIDLIEGFDPAQLNPAPDLIVVGNALSRGNPCVEYMLDQKLSYTSGPQWLGDNLLKDKHVISVSGTHGKTSTSSMLAKILDSAGYHPGYLIGGVPQDFGVSARIGGAAPNGKKYFVIEADEYDTAFFDKRSKFVHYHSDCLIINNLEYDHADIFDDLAAIQRQFHHCVRTVPSNGTIIFPANNKAVSKVLKQGCWSQLKSFAETDAQWTYKLLVDDGSQFKITHQDSGQQATVNWQQTGLHNVTNAMAAVVAAFEIGISVQSACDALSLFVGIKRRMEPIYSERTLTVYDDFAHHPTAIKTTLEGLRAKVGDAQIVAVIEPRSATMRLGVHEGGLASSVASADQVLWYQNASIGWDLSSVAKDSAVAASVHRDIKSLVKETLAIIGVNQIANKSTHIVIMSNGSFEGFHQRVLEQLK
ncbi:MAG: UDP-N-acetylmuramate:L-alanyl-gamma-D-glutamyl-meso-diaminopimelate ligase [Porticoccaceae bacterium]|nr:UDP-N-acetylmuramate:L-alanyl-gamma-D-glutamyl-meso-diaminopimelate ligase [Porticoccaceae bacterium]